MEFNDYPNWEYLDVYKLLSKSLRNTRNTENEIPFDFLFFIRNFKRECEGKGETLLYRLFNPSIVELEEKIYLYSFRLSMLRSKKKKIVPGNAVECELPNENKNLYKSRNSFWWNHWQRREQENVKGGDLTLLFIRRNNSFEIPEVSKYMKKKDKKDFLLTLLTGDMRLNRVNNQIILQHPDLQKFCTLSYSIEKKFVEIGFIITFDNIKKSEDEEDNEEGGEEEAEKKDDMEEEESESEEEESDSEENETEEEGEDEEAEEKDDVEKEVVEKEDGEKIYKYDGYNLQFTYIKTATLLQRKKPKYIGVSNKRKREESKNVIEEEVKYIIESFIFFDWFYQEGVKFRKVIDGNSSIIDHFITPINESFTFFGKGSYLGDQSNVKNYINYGVSPGMSLSTPHLEIMMEIDGKLKKCLLGVGHAKIETNKELFPYIKNSNIDIFRNYVTTEFIKQYPNQYIEHYGTKPLNILYVDQTNNNTQKKKKGTVKCSGYIYLMYFYLLYDRNDEGFHENMILTDAFLPFDYSSTHQKQGSKALGDTIKGWKFSLIFPTGIAYDINDNVIVTCGYGDFYSCQLTFTQSYIKNLNFSHNVKQLNFNNYRYYILPFNSTNTKDPFIPYTKQNIGSLSSTSIQLIDTSLTNCYSKKKKYFLVKQTNGSYYFATLGAQNELIRHCKHNFLLINAYVTLIKNHKKTFVKNICFNCLKTNESI
jgi:hypothetical protein